MATLRTVISDLEEDEASGAIESIDSASDEKVIDSERARAVEENTVHPDEPTASGWLVTLWNEVAALKVRV